MKTSIPRIILIETNEPGMIGSMKRYADLTAMGLGLHSEVDVSRINLASKMPPWIRGPMKTLWHHLSVLFRSYALRRSEPHALFHVIDGSHGYVARVFAKRCVVTVHDLIPRLQCDHRFPVSVPGIASRWIIQQALLGLAHAGHLICVSNSTRKDLLEYLPQVEDHSSVVLSPIEPSFFESQQIEGEPVDKKLYPYVFHIGNNGFYKNRPGVLRIFASIASKVDHRLVMAGPPPTSQLTELTEALGVSNRVEWLKNPTDEQVRSFYRNASLLLFPSLYEGFGWPPVEAMASGCPVVCSDEGSLAEIVGEAAFTESAGNELALANRCLEALTSTAEIRRLRDSGRKRAEMFDIRDFSNRLMEIYRTQIEHS